MLPITSTELFVFTPLPKPSFLVSIFFCLLFIFPGLSLLAQTGVLSSAQKREIHQLNLEVRNGGTIDSAGLFNKIRAIQDVARKSGNKAYFLDAEMVKTFYYFMQDRPENTAQISSILERVKAEAAVNNIDYINARVEERYGHLHSRLGNKEKAFDHWQNQLAISQQLKNPDDGGIMGIGATIYHLADIYYFYGEYRNTISYLRQMLPYVKNNVDSVYLALQGNNTLGICYQKYDLLDSSDYYFKRCQEWAIAHKNPDWEGIANDGIGTNFFLRGKYEQAIPLLKQNWKQALKRNDFWSAGGSLLVLADISLKRNEIDKAEAYLKEARAYASEQMLLRNSKLPLLYPLLARLYTAKGDRVMAGRFIDSTVIIKDRISRELAGVQLMRINQRKDILKQNAIVRNITNEKNAKLRERNLAIALAITLILFSILIYRYQRKKHRRKQQLKEVQLKQQEAELIQATDQLEELARSLAQRNELTAALKQHFSEDPDNDALAGLRNSYIRDWDRFNVLFEKVHAGYISELYRKLPGISPAEMRFMALAKLNFNNKEMAAALGVSSEAIRVTWHRLRKKLDLPKTTSITELVSSII